MPPTRPATTLALFALLLLPATAAPARADDNPARAPLALQAPGRFPTSRESASSATSTASSSSSWWLLGLAVAVGGSAWAVVAISSRKSALAARDRPPIPLDVLGRVPVGPRQAVCLVKVGDQVLILGTGPQGPPALLGELERATEEAPR
jgi:flagellar biogenesis protein FliO